MSVKSAQRCRLPQCSTRKLKKHLKCILRCGLTGLNICFSLIIQMNKAGASDCKHLDWNSNQIQIELTSSFFTFLTLLTNSPGFVNNCRRAWLCVCMCISPFSCVCMRVCLRVSSVAPAARQYGRAVGTWPAPSDGGSGEEGAEGAQQRSNTGPQAAFYTGTPTHGAHTHINTQTKTM